MKRSEWSRGRETVKNENGMQSAPKYGEQNYKWFISHRNIHLTEALTTKYNTKVTKYAYQKSLLTEDRIHRIYGRESRV